MCNVFVLVCCACGADACTCFSNCKLVIKSGAGARAWGNLKACKPDDLPTTCSPLLPKEPKCPGRSTVQLVQPNAKAQLKYQCCCEPPDKALIANTDKGPLFYNCVA